MIDLNKLKISPSASLKDVMIQMTELHVGILCVVTSKDILLGIITDGDIRRAILNGVKIDVSISNIYNKSPYTAKDSLSDSELERLLLTLNTQFVPIVDDNGILTDLKQFSDCLVKPKLPNTAVIMAGGLGTRMSPFTDNYPKSMLNVVSKPILGQIIENLRDQGIQEIYLLLHHLPHIITDYFEKNPSDRVQLHFIYEEKPCGTAGGLRLIKDKLKLPFLVMNGDAIAHTNFRDFISHHEKNDAAISVGSREYSVEIPYGVLKVEDNIVSKIIEKPKYSWQTVCSTYCVSPQILDKIPDSGQFDMPDLIKNCIDDGDKVFIHPIDYITRLEEMTESHKNLWIKTE